MLYSYNEDETGLYQHFVYDALGNTISLTDDSANVTQSTMYDAFGQTVEQTGTSTNNRLRNTKERDTSIGLDTDGFRYYDPETARYLQRDPLGYADGLNAYLSVHNNPVNHVDPLSISA